MHGFINSPALAKLVALQLTQEQVDQSRRARKARPSRAERRALRANSQAVKEVDSPRLSRPVRARPAH